MKNEKQQSAHQISQMQEISVEEIQNVTGGIFYLQNYDERNYGKNRDYIAATGDAALQAS